MLLLLLLLLLILLDPLRGWQERAWLLLELFVCSIHTVPIVSFDLTSRVLGGDTIFYRAETILCAAMFFRLHLVWRWLVYHSFIQVAATLS